MFQTFDATTRPDQGPPRLAALRAEIAGAGLDGFLVPRADPHQGEYVPAHDARLAWLTGFTGSAGFCAVLADRAGVFVDGRYRVQVKAEVALEVFTPVAWPETGLADWLIEALPGGGTIGFDPWLHTAAEVEKLREKLDGSGIELRASDNLVDRVWPDQPPLPAGRVRPWPVANAGESATSKRQRLGAELAGAGHAAAALTMPDSIAWLLNIRGEDIPKVPVPLAFALLHADGTVDLFLTSGRDLDLGTHPEGAVRLHDRDAFPEALKAQTGKVRVDKSLAPLAVSDLLAQPVWGADPCVLPKARKTGAELAGTAEAHLRDGAAMAAFLCWLDREAPGGGLTEIAVVEALEGFRRATNALQDISFDTICGAGPNGAIIHYRVTEATNRPVKPGELLLIDSGGQYLDGTTDITRTVAVGEVGDEEKLCFTRVLKGMIAMSRIRFPKGVAGAHLDTLARAPLWLAGQDYDHGTGHGVGVYLSVHEGPARLSRLSDVPLEPGMILSNEPGYYREGAFGIRIENLLAVEPAPALPGGDAHREMLHFRTLTFVPIDRRLIVTAELTAEERGWIDAYHRDTLAALADRVQPEVRDWLVRACAPL
ncbi:aminopeptidase P family protein [Frigidibacter sp. ROC022]|uniref:aminopeptidase P family protein n=1 Tax=Frigidibacter sp. ROC022 TaxID=2971796 RepID=UPI00215B0DEB|nr:aminopeptidase P family protein [Frigidibacter sp. ROC022]MCR8725147.1 aminopeptidase P family protein [Frigidibacter sp. ROC022]